MERLESESCEREYGERDGIKRWNGGMELRDGVGEALKRRDRNGEIGEEETL